MLNETKRDEKKKESVRENPETAYCLQRRLTLLNVAVATIVIHNIIIINISTTANTVSYIHTIPINTDYSILKLILSSLYSDVLFYATIAYISLPMHVAHPQKPHAITVNARRLYGERCRRLTIPLATNTFYLYV